MSKYVASGSNDGHESREMSGKRGAGDEGDENEEGILDLLATEMIVHGGNDMDYNYSLEEKRNLVTRVIFHLDITNVGQRACFYAVNLVVVDIPDGIKSIGRWAFSNCKSLTTVSLPRTLTFIVHQAFAGCSSLENIDLLHTNLQVLEGSAFWGCSELKSMTIPDSLQTLVAFVFHNCSKLVPSNIIVNDDDNDTTSKVVAHLRSKMQREEAERIAQEKNDARARRLQQRQARREKTK
ncbi:hypothetical protein TL16_g01225 [Triparma laevis f. inornata]|uniref:Uncharacterized protein n=1 Tax=Triparma laevis f. inornata TaxID=1714386 RepID=A0A9W7DSA4_9STRA|nr:hypothetical protein TL16_g01225 [Triparma laevis f. inornata]